MWTNTLPEFNGPYWYYRVGGTYPPIPTLVLIHRGRLVRFGFKGDTELPFGSDHWYLKIETPDPPSMMQILMAHEEFRDCRIELETIWGKF